MHLICDNYLCECNEQNMFASIRNGTKNIMGVLGHMGLTRLDKLTSK